MPYCRVVSQTPKFVHKKRTYVSQTVNDPEVIDLIPGRVVLVGRSKTPVILVEDKARSALTLLQLVGHPVASLAHQNRFLGLYHVSQLPRPPLALQLGRRPHENRSRHILLLGDVPSGVEHPERLIPQILLVPPLKIVDADQQRVVHDM